MKLYKIYDVNMNNEEQETELFKYLVDKCAVARQRAEEARNEQLEIEQQILALQSISQQLKQSGTTNFGSIKITTKLNQKWDQKVLADILAETELPINPFDIEYKASAARLKVLKDQYPNAYKKLSIALTEAPAKPYFTFNSGE